MLVKVRQDTFWWSELCCGSQTANPESDTAGASKDCPHLKSCTYLSIYMASNHINLILDNKKSFFYILKYCKNK